MKKTRRIVAIAAATIALTAGLTPAASAQNAGDLLGGAGAINKVIDEFNCDVLKTLVTESGLVNDQTTRNELAATLRTEAGLKALGAEFQLIGSVYASRIADRALVCGAVKPDPQQDILTQLQNFSSNLSS